MRIWSLHPSYLDAKGLVALWRETLLAQKVLRGETKGYRHHPQLQRFRATRNPVGAVATYLRAVADEADRRGYTFDRERITRRFFRGSIAVTDGQVDYEFRHLLDKLKMRDRKRYEQARDIRRLKLHPLFRKVRGPVEDWEVI